MKMVILYSFYLIFYGVSIYNLMKKLKSPALYAVSWASKTPARNVYWYC